MNKRRMIFQRAAALLCCILLLPSFVAVSASAEITSDDVFLDLLDYGAYYYFHTITTTNNSFTFPLPAYNSIKYVDFVFYKTGGSISNVYVTIDSGTRTKVNILSLGNGYYRCYGPVTGAGTNLTVSFDVSSTVWLQLASFKLSLFNMDVFPDLGGVWVSDSPTGSGYIYMGSPTDSVYVYMKPYDYTIETGYNTIIQEFNGRCLFPNWRKYDYIDVLLYLNDCNFSTICVQADNTYVPFEVSFLDSSVLESQIVTGYVKDGPYVFEPEVVGAYNRVMLRIDLTGLNRSSIDGLYIDFSGQYSSNDAYVMMRSVNGFLLHSQPNQLTVFFNNLKSFLSDLFGKDDPAAGAAQQTQQQVDQEINMQIVQAMEDWDTNIQYAETGFTSGLSLVSPSVAWISLLATRIFDNMQGFGFVYIMVGFMSVIMLLLSKSGIAAKIGHMGRSKK